MAILELGGSKHLEINYGSMTIGMHVPVVNYTLWSWGYNSDGQLGNNSPGNFSSPQNVATSILSFSADVK